jgi:hypothetical protein
MATIVASASATSAATAAASPTTAAETAPTTASATEAFPAAEATGAVCFWLGFIDLESAAAEFGPVQRGDGFLCLARVGHLDEGKPARTASIAVSHHAHFFHGAMSFEDTSQLGFGRGMR